MGKTLAVQGKYKEFGSPPPTLKKKLDVLVRVYDHSAQGGSGGGGQRLVHPGGSLASKSSQNF